jgi:DNA polymerase III delta subunit
MMAKKKIVGVRIDLDTNVRAGRVEDCQPLTVKQINKMIGQAFAAKDVKIDLEMLGIDPVTHYGF